MIPSGVHELLANDGALVAMGISGLRIIERESTDVRPFANGYFVVVSFEESDHRASVRRGPRVMTLWVHTPWDRSRDYRPIDRILSRIDQLFSGVEHYTGSDGVRITGIRKAGASGNLRDPAWKTICRNAAYQVLYDESAV